MEELFTTNFLDPSILFSELDPNDIIDYVISSYTVNMSFIHAFYWHPKLRVYCDKSANEAKTNPPDLDYVRYIQVATGIYHPKFVYITTSTTLRFVITTCNFTGMVINVTNDYYRLTLKTARSPVENNANRNVQLLEKFFQTYGIAITRRPSEFNWSNVSARLLVNINDYTTHETLFKEYMLGERFNEVYVMCSAVSTKYADFLELFNAGNLNFVYLENYAEFEKMGIYSFQNAVEKPGVRPITKRYELPYHVKRYWLRNPRHELFILTSANLTPQAWCKNGFKNVELGIIIELKKI